MNNYLNTSVTELVTIFRDAAIALIPHVERAKMPWKDGESYDDWDNIVTALYENIICNTLLYPDSDYDIAKYDFSYTSYSNMNFIIVNSKNHIDRSLVFIGFGSALSPLDSIAVAMIDNNYNVVENIILMLENDLDELEFVYVKNENGKRDLISDISVLL